MIRLWSSKEWNSYATGSDVNKPIVLQTSAIISLYAELVDMFERNVKVNNDDFRQDFSEMKKETMVFSSC